MYKKELLKFIFHKNFNFEKAVSFFDKSRSLDILIDFLKKNNFPQETDENIEKFLNLMEKENISLFFYNSKHYPEILKKIKNPPIAIFVKGSIPEGFPVAIIGSRRPLPESVEIAKYFTRELVKRGIVIVSGFARGIDGIAHKETIKNSGKTIAVLGSGHLKLYPPENKDLASEVEKNGALISEYPPFFPPFKKNFPQRNRIISGLSRGVVLIEAGFKSGSLKTANFAIEEGRELFVVPGYAFDERYAGSNYLIKKGAKLVQTIDDILEEFPDLKFEIKKEEEKIEISDEEKRVLDLLCFGKKINFEEILKNFNYEDAIKILTSLELKGFIERLPGNFFIKKIK